jgi:16S rRNA (guanine527-N7)-methyltransferase
MNADLAAVARMLGEARGLGFLGPGPVEAHVAHARGFAAAAASAGVPVDQDLAVVDLGSGGGVPGLVLAALWPDAGLALMDGSARRAEFLRRAVEVCHLEDRVSVWEQRAEDAGRDPQRRGQADLVVARGFGPPSVTAECAAPLLREGGRLVVSEPPGDLHDRWPEGPLGELGLGCPSMFRDRFGFQVMTQCRPCPERFPRRVGVPAKRPLF